MMLSLKLFQQLIFQNTMCNTQAKIARNMLGQETIKITGSNT